MIFKRKKKKLENFNALGLINDIALPLTPFGVFSVLTKEQFLLGKSKPVNKELFDIFRACDFAEESGHGVPSVVKVYGEEAYIFSEYFIDVVIPFNREGFDKTTRKTTTTQPENIEEEIIQLIKNNGNISRKDMAIVLHKTEGSIRHYLKKLQEQNIIKHSGPDKGGYWEIIDNKKDRSFWH